MKKKQIHYLMNKKKSGFLSPYLAKKRALESMKYISKKKMRILDYGCNYGHLSQFFTKNNYVGYDINKEAIKSAKRNFPKYTFLSHKKKIIGKFDYIVSLAVIEHVKNPKFFLKNLAFYLKNKDSKLIFTTPNPSMEFVHKLFSKVGIVSSDADEDHEKLLNFSDINRICDELSLKIITNLLK